MQEFITPANHVHFRAKKLFGEMGKVIDGAIAYIDLNGGGPVEKHTHIHSHLFIVVQGEAKILYGNDEIILKKDQSFLVDGKKPHSVWNNTNEETVMVGISIE